MSNIVDTFYIRKRKLLKLNESETTQINHNNNRYCAVLSNNARVNPNYENLSRFIEQCGSNSEVSNTFIRECIEAVNENGEKYPELVNIVCDKVIPNLDDFTLNDIREDAEMMQNDTIRECVNKLYNMNTVADRIVENHAKISTVYDVENFIYDNRGRISDSIIMDKICSIINEFNTPTVGKFTTALEEITYIYPDIDKYWLINEAHDYFCLACNADSNDKAGMRNVVLNSPVIPDNIRINESRCVTTIGMYCRKFINSDVHDINSLTDIKNNMLSFDIQTIKAGFEDFLALLTKIVSCSTDRDLIEFIYTKLIPELKDELIDRFATEIDGMTVLMSIKQTAQKAIQDCNDRFNVLNPNWGSQIYLYLGALKKFEEGIADAVDLFYPSYNMECATNIMNESITTISLQEFKLFKFDNLITRLWKADKYLQKKFNQFKNKVKAKIFKVRSKIFENSDIYEFLDLNGNIDYCISSFAYSPDADYMELHEYCTNCIRDINRNVFNDSEYICYYEITGDSIEFRVRSNQMAISLTEEDKSILEESISFENMNRASDIVLIGDLLDENFDFVRESIEYFGKDCNRDQFGTYLELCAVAGIDKEVIKEVYYNAQILCSDPSAFVITNSYMYESYEPMKDNIVEVSLEGIIGIQTLLQEGKNLTAAEKRRRTIQKKKEEQLRKWEEENGEDNDNDDEEKPAPKKENKPENKKPNTIVNKVVKNVNTSVKNIKDTATKNMNKSTKEKLGDAASKGMKFFNKVKLYGHGLMQYAKTASNAIKSKIMNMNASSDRLSKSIKAAFMSDRKEAIIKGSIIPSFHKCIAIAVGLAGLWSFNPPLAIISAIGGFAISKKLTQKERALMYDDILIELKLVDKELQLAEDNNNIKKMRELMRIKKELERTAVRIKLGAASGRDIIPGGTTMFRHNED